MQESDYLKQRLSLTEHLAYTRQRLMDALLEMSRSINGNMPITALARVYQHILHAQLGIEHVVFFIRDDTENWQCIENSAQHSAVGNFSVDEWREGRTGICRIEPDDDDRLIGYRYFIPVFHKKVLTGYVFLSAFPDEAGHETDEKLKFIQTITNIVVVANENKKLFRQQVSQIVLQRELSLAADIQNLLVPSQLPDIPGVLAHKLYKPHRAIGGDYFDVIQLSDDDLFFCMVDISGKGIPAALMMANVQAYVRVLATRFMDMREFILQLNHYILQATKGEKYVTLFAGKYHLPTRSLTYINAGHVPPLLFCKGDMHELKKGCTILGMFDQLVISDVGQLTIEPDTWLVCFTDGITESFNNHNRMYDSAGVMHVLKQAEYKTPEEFNRLLLDDMIRFNQSIEFEDDLTLLTFLFK